MADWTNNLQQPPSPQALKSTADYSWPDPTQNALMVLKAADMLDQRQARQIQTNVARLQYEDSEQHIKGREDLSKHASSKATNPNDILTSQGYVSPQYFDVFATKYPREAANERQFQTNTLLGIEAEKRKAAETYRDRLVGAGWDTNDIRDELSRAFPDVMGASANTLPQTSATSQTNQNAFLQRGTLGVPPTQAPSAPSSAAGRIVIDAGGSHGMTTIQELQATPQGRQLLDMMRLNKGATAPSAIPTTTAPVPASTTVDQPSRHRQQFLDAVEKAQTNSDPQKGLEELGHIRPRNNWEMREIKDARMFLATRAKDPKNPTTLGLEAELEDSRTTPQRRAEIQRILDKDLQRQIQITGGKVGAGARAKTENAKTGLSETTLNNEGIKYLVTGQISMGFGGKEDREAIMNRKNKFMDENHLTETDVLTIQASFDADKKALNNLQKRATMTAQSAGQAKNNAEALLKTSENFGRYNYPAPNRIAGWWAKNLGSPERQASFGRLKVALNAWAREYMRVTTGAAASVAELTAGAQAKVDEMLSTSDSWSTLKAKVKQGQVEMDNVTKSHNDELKSTQRRLMNPMEYVKQLRDERQPRGFYIDISAIDAELAKRGVK